MINLERLQLPVGGQMSALGTWVPFRSDALHYSKQVIDTIRPDRIGALDRTSVMSKKFVGDLATGTYIDTGIVPNENTELKIVGKFTNILTNLERHGVETSAGDNRFWFGTTFAQTWQLAYGDVFPTGGTADEDEHVFEIKNGNLYIDDVLEIESNYTSFDASDEPIYLLARNNNGTSANPCNFDMYYAEITHNGEVITFTPEEVTDPEENPQTTFYDTSGQHEAQAYSTHAGWVANSVHGVANSDQYGVTVAQALGKNKFNKDDVTLGYRLDETTGELFLSVTFCTSNFMEVSSSTDYVRSGVTQANTRMVEYDEDRNYISGTQFVNEITTSANTKYIRTSFLLTELATAQFEAGTSGTTYVAWEGYWKDQGHTIPYADGQPLHALDLQDGTFSRQFCKAWLDTGARAPLDSVGRIKHQVDYGVALLNEVDNGDTEYQTLAGTEVTHIIDSTLNIPSGHDITVAVYQDVTLTTNVRNTFQLTDSLSANFYETGASDANLPAGWRVWEFTTSSIINILKYWCHTPNIDVVHTDFMIIDKTDLGITAWSEAQMLSAVQDGFFDEYKLFEENYTDDPNSLRLAQDYPLVQSADLTDTLVDDHTLDEPTNAVVEVATLIPNIGDQIFSLVDSGDLIKFSMYDREMTTDEVEKIETFLGI